MPQARVEQLKEKIATVKAHMRKLKRIEKVLPNAPDEQISLTDPDARSMATSGRGTGIVGYNVQAAVDTRNQLTGAPSWSEVSMGSPATSTLPS